MEVLISPVSLEEAKQVVEGGADIVDIKNVKEGSLGAQFPWVTKTIVEEFRDSEVLTSATLGDLPYKPGTAALAALGAASCGVDYIKAGLHGVKNYVQAFHMMESVVQAIRMVSDKILTVASGYADFRRFDGVHYREVIKAAKNAGADGVMVDTAIKDGKNIMDAMSVDEIAEFIGLAKEADLFAALAGSIGMQHLDVLAQLDPDIIGVRGAVCDRGQRKKGIVRERVMEFMQYVEEISVHDSGRVKAKMTAVAK